MNLLFINKIKIKGIYPAIINIPLSKLHNIPNIGIKPKKNKCIKLNFFNLIISYTIIRKINSGNSLQLKVLLSIKEIIKKLKNIKIKVFKFLFKFDPFVSLKIKIIIEKAVIKLRISIK